MSGNIHGEKKKVREFWSHGMDVVRVYSKKVSILLAHNRNNNLHLIYFTANNQQIVLFTKLAKLILMLINVFVFWV